MVEAQTASQRIALLGDKHPLYKLATRPLVNQVKAFFGVSLLRQHFGAGTLLKLEWHDFMRAELSRGSLRGQWLRNELEKRGKGHDVLAMLTVCLIAAHRVVHESSKDSSPAKGQS